ncbi:patatin-like phospholipase family protein [Aestuariibacter sp. AA17]|uniref:Patatin-like phospholipase family protein n=1 Tax=Fluctibacter corallii TaxID=2984329 RepID=A0ABT3ABF5_9ALTE|nr:patatin-like phospholipase family protein [Aestuariibacter sp. AA17]MCV2886011.1 patatin-like phospholipase family protein [Aestuariibacter sp. AA17]
MRIVPPTSFEQNSTIKHEDITRIVPIFSGGGTRLTAHIGILHALESLPLAISHMVGVSGGSIVSALYCSGMKLDDIMALAIETDFKQFRGYSLFRLLKDGGLSDGEHFEQWMDKKLRGLTFADIEYDLSIVATDVNGGGPVIFNREYTPELKVSAAVRFSMSIPLIFSFKPFRDYVLTDGAILSEDALFNDWTGDATPNLCFRLRGAQTKTDKKRAKFFQLPEFIFMLIRTFMTALSREYVHANHWHNTIVVDTGEISSVEFNLTKEQKFTLYKQGFDTAMMYVPKKLNLQLETNVPDITNRMKT